MISNWMMIASRIKMKVGLRLMLISASQGLEIFFFLCFHVFSFWLSFFWIENYHSLFIPVKFFHYFFIPVFPPFGIFMFLSFASKMVLGLGNCHQGLFLEPFSFLFILCRLCIVLVMFSLPLPWKLSLEIIKRSFFSNPFRFFSFFYRFGYVSFLCLEKWPWKLSKNAFLEPFSLFFRVFFVLASFPPLPSKLTLEIVKRIKRSFSRIFCFLFHVRFHFRFFPCFFLFF